MANLIDGVGKGIENLLFKGMGNTLPIIVILLAVIVFFAIIFAFLYWKGFNIKVKVYEPMGQTPLTEKDKVEIKANKDSTKLIERLKKKKVKFNHIRYKTTHGKFTTIKGTQYFITFMPLRRLPPIPMTLLYDDGVHLVRLSRDIFVPIPKPEINLVIGENVSISVEEDVQWKAWNNLMADRINNKYQDLDAQKRIALYFITGIVALVLIGGFLLWLMFKLASKNLIVADKFSDVVQGLLGGRNPS